MTTDQASDKPTTAASARNVFWPAFIVSLVAFHILASLVMVFLCTRDRSFSVEPDYYQKSLHWDDTALQQRENVRLGWAVAIEVGPALNVLGERKITCRVTAGSGEPIERAAVDLVAFSHARASERTALVLLPAGRGIYQATHRFARQGLWEFRIVIARDGETFTYTEQRQV
ncbi:MAG: FixH family protein [Candidatus Rokubacteria bacterium]|nr:FixH family protein [Candidatus Rokubacteria bacterium]